MTMTLIAQDTSADYSMSETSSTNFSIALSGTTMTGGQNGSPTPGGLNHNTPWTPGEPQPDGIANPEMGPLFASEQTEDDLASGTIYVLRSKSDIQ